MKSDTVSIYVIKKEEHLCNDYASLYLPLGEVIVSRYSGMLAREFFYRKKGITQEMRALHQTHLI